MSETFEFVCVSCGRTLRIAAEHAGKQVRCPACQQISSAPGSAPMSPPLVDQASAPATSDETPRWHVRTPEGTIYGPITWGELLTWVSEGRVASDCEIAAAADGPWQPAPQVLPVLQAPLAEASGLPSAAQTPPRTGIPSAYTPQPLPPGVAPHRGALIFAFGLLGIVVGCPVFSVLAWLMGTQDLREIRAGRMDRQGESLTLVGMILGMIISIIWLLSTLLILTIALIAIAAQF